MRTAVLVFIGLILLALESPLVYHLNLYYLAPDAVLILAIYLALSRPLLTGAITTFILGFFKDSSITQGKIDHWMGSANGKFIVTEINYRMLTILPGIIKLKFRFNRRIGKHVADDIT